MLGKHRPLFALLISLSLFSIRSQAQDGKALVAEALRAVGAENLRTIEVTGSGSTAGIGQNRNPTLGWPTARLKSYTRQLDLSLPASNVQMIRVQNNRDVSQSQVISSNSPWSQEYDLWISPYGFLQGAMANPVTVRAEALDGVKYNVISFTLQSKYKLQGYLGSQNLLERVRTWVDNDVLGDMLVEAVYGDYKDFGGVKVPSTMIVKQGGFATRILIVSDAKINVPVTIPPVPPPPA
ncbi:MAG TPA: hypothetical protein VJ732_01100, partial [Bryobacteraceae bacterium]|nr:hypothetical protein [Bryobacteraceae bacterium]